MLDVTPIISEPLQVRYPSENEEVNEDEDEEDDDEEDVDEVDLEDVDEVEGGVSVNSSDESQDESLDPEWKNGQDYSSENVSSESIGDMLTTSDDEGSNDDGETALSGEEYEETFRRPRRYGDERHPNSNILRVPNPINDGGRIVLRQWQSFGNFRSFNAILKDYCIQEGFEIEKKKYERTRVTAICKAEGCPWRIHASLAPDKLSFMIKTFTNRHTCTQVRSNRIATSTWLAKHLLDSFKIHPNMSIDAMRAEIKNRFGLDVCNRRLWRARAMAKEDIEGSHAQSFKMLQCYASMVFETNPDSVSIVNSELIPSPNTGRLEDRDTPPPRFKRIFICFDGVRKEFIEGCRPFFGLDGCHLKGPYKGVLLAAVGLDGNLQFYPIAYAIVESENKETWEWFVMLLKESIGETYSGIPWTIMSDRQKVSQFILH